MKKINLLALGATLFIVMSAPIDYASAAGGGGGDGYQAEETDIYELRKAKSAIRKEDFPTAYGYLVEAVKKKPKNADIHNLLGFSSRKMGRYEESEGHYQQALKLDPNHKGALEYMGELYLTLNRPDEARQLLERLGDVCWFSCTEERDLKKAIEEWEAKNS